MIKPKTSYITHEYTYENEYYDGIIIKVYVDPRDRDKDGKYLLNISLKTSDNMGLEHFIVGYYINNASERTITEEVFSLAESEYFDDFIELALDDEYYLEEKFEDGFNEDKDKD